MDGAFWSSSGGGSSSGGDSQSTLSVPPETLSAFGSELESAIYGGLSTASTQATNNFVDAIGPTLRDAVAGAISASMNFDDFKAWEKLSTTLINAGREIMKPDLAEEVKKQHKLEQIRLDTEYQKIKIEKCAAPRSTIDNDFKRLNRLYFPFVCEGNISSR
eukprot:SAG31_NODE_1858_length_7061_cov_60.221201_5_plen_161_part_00